VQVAREIQIHSGLDHEHIVGLYGAFEDGKHVYLVQEFAPGVPRITVGNHSTRCEAVQPGSKGVTQEQTWYIKHLLGSEAFNLA